MNDLAKRLIVGVVLFFLVAFGYVKLKELAAVEAENRRLEAVNTAIQDTVDIWREQFVAIDTVLQRQLATIDSLSARTGPIRWRTVRDTIIVIEPGRIDTIITVQDSVPIVALPGDSAVHVIPVAVALELQECRLLTTTCAEFKTTADSTIKWQATHIDTLQAQVVNLGKVFDVPSFNMLGLALPLPSLTAGYGLMYSMNSCPDQLAQDSEGFAVEVSGDCDRLHHGFLLGLTWSVWSP